MYVTASKDLNVLTVTMYNFLTLTMFLTFKLNHVFEILTLTIHE